MPHIHVLDADLSNQIAAGEVVERPASVVKELCENALDAGSSIIEVHLEEGGLQKIKVIDNGLGMSRQDSRLAFERHATSKLKTDRDLFRIATLGFRGEALPSISAVSKVSMQTWDGQEETGTKLMIEGGQVQDIEDAPLRKGTVLEVSHLFYNTPARYKYLKTIHTELSHVTNIVNRLALAHPSVAFTVSHQGRTIFKTNGNGHRLAVIAAIYGHNTAKKMIPFSGTHIDFEVDGYVGQPECSRSSRSHISLFINGRYVKHYPLIQAILRAYHTLLPIHRYPIAVLALRTDPSLLDVNVHPSKLEIRLSKEKEMLEWLEQELKEMLQEQELIPQPLAQNKSRPTRHTVQPSLDLRLPEKGEKHHPQGDMKRQERRTEKGKEVRLEQRPEERPLAPAAVQIRETGVHFPAETENKAKEQEQQENQAKQSAQQDHRQKEPEEQDEQVRQEGRKQHEQGKIPLLFPMAQLHGTYILAQNENGLYMVDQHAAQERIWYERYVQQLDQPVYTSQELALPLVLEFTPGEASLIEEHRPLLEKTGLFLEHFGYHSYRVRSHPGWFPDGAEEELIREMIEYVTEQKKEIKWSTLRDEVAMMMSCKQAIKANRYLTQPEMEALVEELRHTTNPFTCPHGRPITVLLTKYDIEKMFKRVM